MNMSSKEINKMSKIRTNDVLTRLKSALAVNSDTALAKVLNTSAQTISSWKARNHIPYAICVNLALTKGLSLDWLILGIRAPLQSSGHSVNEPSDRYGATQSKEPLNLLNVFGELDKEQQQEILRGIQEKYKIKQIQQQIEYLENELNQLKNVD